MAKVTVILDINEAIVVSKLISEKLASLRDQYESLNYFDKQEDLDVPILEQIRPLERLQEHFGIL